MHYLLIQWLYITIHCTMHHSEIRGQIRQTLRRISLSKTYALHASLPKEAPASCTACGSQLEQSA